jgi:DnaJ-class molecular chaperone
MPVEQKDYYNILGLDRNAPEQEIRAAYRRLAFQYHPDRNKEGPAATEKMKEINEAYAILSDPSKRGEYDFLRERYGSYAYARYRQSHSPGDIFSGSDIDQVLEELARQFGFRDFSEILREFYGPEYQSFDFRRTGTSGRTFVFYHTSGETAKEPEAYPPRPAIPGLTSGGFMGKMLRFLLKRVMSIELPEKGKDWKDKITLSPKVAQDGGEIQYRYQKWGKPKNLMIRIPAGTKEGHQIRLKGMGAPGKGGGEPGDLYLRVRLKIPFLRRVRNVLKRWAI